MSVCDMCENAMMGSQICLKCGSGYRIPSFLLWLFLGILTFSIAYFVFIYLSLSDLKRHVSQHDDLESSELADRIDPLRYSLLFGGTTVIFIVLALIIGSWEILATTSVGFTVYLVFMSIVWGFTAVLYLFMKYYFITTHFDSSHESPNESQEGTSFTALFNIDLNKYNPFPFPIPGADFVQKNFFSLALIYLYSSSIVFAILNYFIESYNDLIWFIGLGWLLNFALWFWIEYVFYDRLYYDHFGLRAL